MPSYNKRALEVSITRSRADLVLRNCQLLNVHTREIYQAGVAVVDDIIAYVGEVGDLIGPGTTVVEGDSRFALPGLIDGHIHTYESHLPIGELAPTMLSHGVTTLVTDFYGQAVVGGPDAVRRELDEARASGINVAFVLPMPALYQDRPFAHSGAIDINDMLTMMGWPECIGINECFVSGVIDQDSDLLALIGEARRRRLKLCGHASEASDPDVQGWLTVLRRTDDHETVSGTEAIAKLRNGVRVIAREGSNVANVESICSSVAAAGIDPRHVSFCADLLSPVDLLDRGHIDYSVKLAQRAGVDAITAIQMATINGAECHRIDDTVGSVSAGLRADIVLVDGPLATLNVATVIAGGRVVVEAGAPRPRTETVDRSSWPRHTVIVPALTAEAIQVRMPQETNPNTRHASASEVRVIEVSDGTIVTSEGRQSLTVDAGVVLSDPLKGVNKIAAFERHGSSGAMGVGFVNGFSLREGAFAQTYNPQSQHLLAVGANDTALLGAARACAEMGGGFAVVDDDGNITRVPLPLYGLLSDAPIEELADELRAALGALHALGCRLKAPFHSLAFAGLAITIGRLKISSAGLVDVWKKQTVPVIVTPSAAPPRF